MLDRDLTDELIAIRTRYNAVSGATADELLKLTMIAARDIQDLQPHDHKGALKSDCEFGEKYHRKSIHGQGLLDTLEEVRGRLADGGSDALPLIGVKRAMQKMDKSDTQQYFKVANHLVAEADLVENPHPWDF